MNAKDFALYKAEEILQLCDDLICIENKTLRIQGLENIKRLTTGIKEHLEYLDIIEENKHE